MHIQQILFKMAFLYETTTAGFCMQQLQTDGKVLVHKMFCKNLQRF